MRRILFTAFPGLLLLLGVLNGAPVDSLTLSAANRLPLPDSIEINGIASSARAVWFAGLDHSSEPATPAVFAWSEAGIARLSLPEGTRVNRTDLFDIATRPNGEALLLIDGQVWISSGSTLHKVDTRQQKIIRIAGGVRFWLLTETNEILQLSTANEPLHLALDAKEEITAWTSGRDGSLWYATRSLEVRSLDAQGTPQKLVIPSETEVTAILTAPGGTVWIATVDGHLGHYNGERTDWFEMQAGPAVRLAQNRLGDLLLAHPQAETEESWISTQPADLRRNLEAQFARVVLKGAAGSVRDIDVDDHKGIWIAVGRSGAFRLEGLAGLNWPIIDAEANTAAQFQRATAAFRAAAAETPVNHAQNLTSFHAMPGARLTFLNTARGLPNNNISCGVSDGANMWFGTGYQNITPENESGTGMGVIRWDHRQATTFSTGLPSQIVQACAFDPDTGALWFGTTNGVARLLNGTFSSYLAGSAVLDVIVKGADIWVATLSGGVHRLAAASGTQTGQYAAGSGRVTSLVFDNSGTLWAGTSTGLYRFNGSSFASESAAPLQPTDYVMDVEVDSANNLWIAVWNKSVFRRSPGGSVEQFAIGPIYNGIRRVYAVRKDNFGNLWFGHGNFGSFTGPATGLTVLPPDQVSQASPAFQAYSQTANGLPNNQVFSFAPEADGMWMGTPGGGVWRIGGPFAMPGFPAALQALPVWTSPLLVDLDHNRDLEIVAADDSGRIYAFRPDGSSLWTYDTRTSLPVPAGALRGPIAIHSSPAAGDVDGDGEIDIVVGLGGLQGTPCYGGALILSRMGEFKRLLPTFDIVGPNHSHTSDGMPEGVFATPVLANVDSDPELEIMFGGFDNTLYAWNGDGTTIYQRDDDGDGLYDEDSLGDITPNTPFLSSDDAPGIKGVDDDGDGKIDEGPFASDDDEDGLIDEDYWEWPQNARDTVYATAVVADLNGDGQKEIVFGTDYSNGTNMEFSRGGVLRVFTPFGKAVSGFPRGNLEQVIWSSPVAVDLDNDGNYELIHGSGYEMQTVGNTTADQLIGRLVYAWRSNGQPFRACGANTAAGCFATTEGRSFASFAVGDLDNDGSPELVIATLPLRNKSDQPINSSGAVVSESQATGQQLYVFRADGSLMDGFPVRPNPGAPALMLLGSPILADVDNDGYLEIILNVRFGLMVFDRTGRVLPGMGLWEGLQEDFLGVNMNGTPAVADIDLDGTLEMVWLTPTLGSTTGLVRVVKLAPSNSTYQRSWPQWRRGINRNAIFGPLVSLTQAWDDSGTLVMRAQAFTGRAPATSVTLDLSALGGPAAQPMVAAGNAFYEYTTSGATVPPGRYHLPVTITDATGRMDTQTLILVKRGGVRQLALSDSSLAFGSIRQGETGMKQLGIVNTGNEAVTITNIASNSGEFFLANPTTFPQTVQPGRAAVVTLRYRPGPAAGVRSAVLTVQSNDTAAAVRTVALAGSTAGGSNGCSVTLEKLTTSNTVTGAADYKGEKGKIRITTSPAGCAWNSSSDSAWLQVFPLTGSGNADLSYTVYPNLSVRPRSAKILVNGSVLPVNQGQAIEPENVRFIAALYFATFGRYPTANEASFHLNSMGSDRAAKAADFFTSAEFNFQGRFIAGVYLGILGRLPEYGGWFFQRNAVAQAGAGAQQALAANFLQSQEFLQRNPGLTSEQFIRFLYQSILGRPASQAEVNWQTSMLGNGNITARAQKATEFLNVPEYSARTGPDLLANLIYFVFLQRAPTAEEFTAMRARIPTGATKQQLTPIIREILESAEYRKLLID